MKQVFTSFSGSLRLFLASFSIFIYGLATASTPGMAQVYELPDSPIISTHAAITTGENTATEIKTLRLYPQPFRNELNISWGNEGYKKNITIQVFDLLGQTRYEVSYPEINTDVQNIDLSDLTAGIYLVTISSPGTRQTFKVSKL